MAQLKIDDVVLGEIDEDFAQYMKDVAKQCGPGDMMRRPRVELRRTENRTAGYFAGGALMEMEETQPIEMEFQLDFHPSRRYMTRTVPRWAY